MSRTLLDRQAVAARLGHSIAWWYKHAPALLASGFPEPVLGGGAGARWDPAAIDAWLDRKIKFTPPLDPPIATPADPSLAEETAELERRTLALANKPARRRA